MPKKKPRPTVCEWEYSGAWSNYWVQCCGGMTVSMDNLKFIFCPFCSKKIKEKIS